MEVITAIKEIFNPCFVSVLIYGGIALGLGIFGYLIIVNSDEVVNPVFNKFGKIFVLALVPIIIIIGLLAVGKMLTCSLVF